MSKLFLIFSFVLFFPETSIACRCKPEGLHNYFEGADYVFLAKIDGHDDGILRFDTIGEPFKGDLTSIKNLITPKESSLCGISLSEPTEYLIFANTDSEDNKTATTHLCNGTRPFSLAKPSLEPAFQDLNHGQTLKALYNLKVTAKIAKNGIGGVALSNSIIGMLAFPELVDLPSTTLLKNPINIYSSPEDEAPLQRKIPALSELKTREIGYEMEAALVFHRSDEWSQVKLLSGEFGWVKDSESTRFHSLKEILPGRVSYLTRNWDRLIWRVPGADIPTELSMKGDEIAVDITSSKEIANSLWFKVHIYKENPCSNGNRDFTWSGWIPAWNAKGELSIWFWSRGC